MHEFIHESLNASHKNNGKSNYRICNYENKSHNNCRRLVVIHNLTLVLTLNELLYHINQTRLIPTVRLVEKL